MSEHAAGLGEGEATELPDKNEDTTVYTKELQEYKKGTPEEPEETEWDPSAGIEIHPLFWFVWEKVPDADNSAFLKRLCTLMGQEWVLDAHVEKALGELSLVVVKGDDLFYLEIYPEVSGLVISGNTGELLLELTARKFEGKTCCFSSMLCNRKLMDGTFCTNEALPGITKCIRHSNPNIGRKSGQKRLAVTSVTTGVQCLPADAYYFWKQKKPEIAHFVDDLAESFRLKLNWEPSHTLMNELRYIAVQMVTRNLMHNKAIEADFKSAIHDPATGQIVAFKAHYLLDKITTFDARIQQKLKDFGLLVPPSRTEDPHKIPIELELLWTPVKKVNAIDVTARLVEPGKGAKED